MTHKITLFAKDAGDADSIAAAFSGLDGVTLNRRDCSLTVANGTAHSLAASGEILLFRTDHSDPNEIGAVRELVSATDNPSKIIAVSDPDMPLSRVRQLMDAGVAEVLPMPVDAATLQRSLDALKPTPIAPVVGASKRGRVITVAQSRGGVGSTTLAVNLADALQGKKRLVRKGDSKRVAVVDLDLQFGGIASFLDVEANDSMMRMATDNIVPDATFLSQALVESHGGLFVLTAPTDFVPLEALSREQIDALIDHLTLNFDFVVIDLPRTLVHWVQAVLNRSDQLLLVTDSTVPAIRQSKRLITAYQEENPTLPIEIVINHEAKPLIKGRHHAQAAKLLERELSYWLPSDPKPAREALDRGVPLAAISGRSRLTKAIGKMAQDIQSNPDAASVPTPPNGDIATFTSRQTKEESSHV